MNTRFEGSKRLFELHIRFFCLIFRLGSELLFVFKVVQQKNGNVLIRFESIVSVILNKREGFQVRL